MTSRERKTARLRVSPAILQRSRDLRRPLTPTEQRLWARLRDHALGLHIRRQHIVLKRFIVDFYCAYAKVCIEIDGDTHAEADQADYDAARTRSLEEHGYRVIRFTNADVRDNVGEVLRKIQEECGASD